MKRFGSGGSSRFQFPADRYGADELGRFLSYTAMGCLLVALIGPKSIKGSLSLISMGLLIWCYSRIFSKNVTRRRAENDSYLRKQASVTDWFRLRRDCFRQRKEYAFFRCPGCSRTVRVPRGKGHIRITCPHCGYTFDKKT